MSAHYFIQGEYFGKSEVHVQARSAVLFCRRCAEVWARIVVDNCLDCDVFQNACSEHTNAEIWTAGQPPGCLIPSVYVLATEAAAGSPFLLHNLPPAVLKREFLVTLNKLESQ